MKKQLLLLPVALACIAIAIVITTNDNPSDKKRSDYEKFLISNGKMLSNDVTSAGEKNPGADRPDQAAFSEFVKTLDPAIKRVPAELRFEAIQKTDRINSLKSGSNKLDWKSHRVDLGGRTRALMFNPNDPSGMGMYAGAVSGGLWYNDNTLEDHDWQPINDYWPNLAVSCMTYDPQDTETMYVGTGESQTAIIIYRESSTRGIGIMKSTDGGKEWDVMPSTTDWAYVTDIQIRIEDGVSVIYAGVVSGIYKGSGHQSGPSDGLYRSVDGGETWTQVLPNIPGLDVPYAPSDISVSADNSRIFIGTTYGINADATDLQRAGAACILFSDDGINWTANRNYNSAILNNEVAKYPGRVMLANSVSDPENVYAIVSSGFPAGAFLGYACEFLLKSTDNGETWTELNFPQDFAPLAWHAFAIEINPEDSDVIWLGGRDVWRTLDGGLNWLHMTNWAESVNSGTGRYVHADIHTFLHKPGNPRQMYIATDGGVFVTGSSLSPDNVAFHERSTNYNSLQFYSCDIHPEEGREQFVGGLQDNGTLLYQPGITPDRGTKVGGGDGAYCFFDQDDPHLTLSTHYYTALHLYEIGPGNSGQFHGSFYGNVGTFINPMDYNWKNNTVYCNMCSYGGDNPNILGLIKIEDWQMEGSVVNLSTNSPVPYTCVKWDENSEVEESTVYLGTESGRLFKLKNAVDPETLSEITGNDFPTGYISSIDIGQSPDTLLVTFSNYGVASLWLSTDAGISWTDIETNLPDMPIRWGIFHPESSTHIMLATETGIWTTNNSLNSNVTWSPDIDGMANVRVDMLQMRDADNTVLAATHGRGMFTTQWNLGGTSSVHDITLSEDLKIYPNPCKGEFTIETELTQESTLIIMDTQGRIVLEEIIQAGELNKQYNLSTEPKGLYIARIQSGQNNLTQKILLR